MRLLTLLVGSLLLIIAVVVALLLTPELGDVGGKPHEQFSTMASGGSASARHANVLWLGGLFGAASLVFFVALMVPKMKRGRGPPRGSGGERSRVYSCWLGSVAH